jgi:thioesterase domain-containing protein
VEALEVENALLRHPAVANAAVCIVSDASENAVLTAALMANPGPLPAPAAVRTFLLGSLPEYAVPARFVFVETFPATPSGKLDRKALPDFIASQPKTAVSVPATLDPAGSNPLLDRILQIWSTALNARLQPDDDFFIQGGDSLQAVATMAALQSGLNQTLSPGLIVEHSTARRLAEYLSQVSPVETPAVTKRALRPGQGGYFPVYFLPPWNHGCTLFRDLARVSAPGRAHPWFALESFNPAEAIPDSIEVLAARYLRMLSQLHPDTPFCLAGYSAGGFIAWEIARQLSAAGRRDVRVILLDCPRMFAHLNPAEAAAEAHAKRPWVKMGNLISHAIRPRGLHRSDFIRELLCGKLSWWLHRRYRQPPPDPYARAYQANIQLSSRYRVRPLPLPVAVIRARYQASWLARFQADLGWAPFCQGSLTINEVNSSHLEMLYAPAAQSTAETIDRLTAKWAAAD